MAVLSFPCADLEGNKATKLYFVFLSKALGFIPLSIHASLYKVGHVRPTSHLGTAKLACVGQLWAYGPTMDRSPFQMQILRRYHNGKEPA